MSLSNIYPLDSDYLVKSSINLLKEHGLVRGGGYFRNFWVGMCRWDLEPLTYVPELVQLNFATLY